MSQDNKAIAEQLTIIGEAFMALSTMFLVDGDKAGKSAGASKAAAKPATKSKSVPKDEPTEDDVRTALKGLMDKHGKDKMVEALATVGAGKLGDVDESQYSELLENIEGFMAAEPEAPEPEKKTRKPRAKKGPSLDDVTAKFKELIESDKALAKSVLKELGVAKVSELEEDQYQEAIDAVAAALEGGEDDDLI
jgi:hypothetical protein